MPEDNDLETVVEIDEEAATEQETASSGVTTPEEIERLANERADAIVAQRMSAMQPQTATQAQPSDPYSQARAEADAQGRAWDTDFINARALEINTDRTVEKVVAVLGPKITTVYQKDALATVAGEDPRAREFAQEFIQMGADVSNPRIKELIWRASSHYSTEKTPSKVNVRPEGRGEPAPAISAEARASFQHILDAAPHIKLTDAEIREAMSQ